jgi:hydrogenase nickel incorporation protein HypA/HybF
MHEYGIARGIVETAVQNAGSRKILKITLAVGDLSGILAESVAMYCDLIIQEKQGAAAEIIIKPVRAEFLCTCGAQYSPEKRFDPCPSCGGIERNITRGTECTVESIEVEDE